MSGADTVRAVAASVGVKPASLSSEAAREAAFAADAHVRAVIQEAARFAKHSKREEVRPADITAALRALGEPTVLGYAGPDEPEYARVASGLWLLRSTVEVEDLAAAATAPLPPLPVGPSLALHWLAVDGVQPQIAENPSPGASAAAAATLEQAASGAPPPVTIEALTRREGTTVQPPVAHALSRELRLYYERIVSVLLEPRASHAAVALAGATASKSDSSNGRQTDGARAGGEQGAGAAVGGAGSGAAAGAGGNDVPSLEDVERDSVLDAVYASLAGDLCVRQLLPYLSAFIASEVNRNLRDLSRLTALVAAVQALLRNPHLDASLELYLHQLMPALLTCVVGKRLCGDPATEDHWTLRDCAASLVAAVVDKYADTYPLLRQRVTKPLSDALASDKKPVTTWYGAVVGLSKLGDRVVSTLLVPHVPRLVARLDAIVEAASAAQSGEAPSGSAASDGAVKASKVPGGAVAAARCRLALLRVAADFLAGGEEGRDSREKSRRKAVRRRKAALQSGAAGAGDSGASGALDDSVAAIKRARAEGSASITRPEKRGRAENGERGAGGGTAGGEGGANGGLYGTMSETFGEPLVPQVPKPSGANGEPLL